MSDRPMAAVKSLVERDGRILGLKITAGEQHMWTLPGGSIEHGENPENALHRKVEDQLGLDVTPGEPFGVYHYFTSPEGDQVVVTVFSILEVDGAVDINTENQGIVDYQWFQPGEMLEKNLNQDLEQLLRDRFDTGDEEREEDSKDEEEESDLPKLVRDNIPEIMREDGEEPVIEQVEDDAMPQLLREKVLEEARELQESGEIEEAADIYEALDRYIELEDARERVQKLRQQKAEERGAFDDNLVLEERGE